MRQGNVAVMREGSITMGGGCIAMEGDGWVGDGACVRHREWL